VGGKKPPSDAGEERKPWGLGMLFIGDKGQLLSEYDRATGKRDGTRFR
jgi:hypothetical protein